MKKSTICNNLKAAIIRTMADGLRRNVPDLLIHMDTMVSQTAVHKAVGVLAGLRIVQCDEMVGDYTYGLTAKGQLVADALELLDTIQEIHERGGESPHHTAMIERARHRAQRLVEAIVRGA